MSEINAQAKRIEADRTMDGAAKRERLDQLERRRHELARRVTAVQ